ncbi:MAG: archease [Elusimicrobia bacterium]|nr:archease [Elusimicrobiota bacterium]
MAQVKKFKVVDHTADLGIIIYGRTLEELFENAATGMFSLITSIEKIKEKVLIPIRLEADDYEMLLVSFLNELQYYYSVKKILFRRFKILTLNKTCLDVNVSGEKISGHEITHDIKAATHHNLKIEKTPDGFKTQVIFDV